jgi:hypothetical protein
VPRPATGGNPPQIDELALLEANANALAAVLVRIGLELIEIDRHVQFLALAMRKRFECLDPIAFETAGLMDVPVEDPLDPELREGLGRDEVRAVAVEVPVAKGGDYALVDLADDLGGSLPRRPRDCSKSSPIRVGLVST